MPSGHNAPARAVFAPPRVFPRGGGGAPTQTARRRKTTNSVSRNGALSSRPYSSSVALSRRLPAPSSRSGLPGCEPCIAVLYRSAAASSFSPNFSLTRQYLGDTIIPNVGNSSDVFARGDVMPCSHVSRICAIAPILFSFCTAGFAQGSRGSITGRILDQQNAVIPAAAVAVKDLLTGVTSKTVSNQTGYYEANFLDPGTYSVLVEVPGFKAMLRPGIVLETGGRLSIDLRLEVGQANRSEEHTSE